MNRVCTATTMKKTFHLSLYFLGALICTTSACLPPALAQGATTPLQGASAVRKGDLPIKLAQFFQAEARERKLPTGNDEPAQIWIWKGDAYKPGHAAFWRSAHRKSLETTGYVVKELDSHDVRTNIFSQEYGLARFDDDAPAPSLISLEIGDKLNYFTATHKETGRTLMGLWIDQTEAGNCVLAVVTVGTKAPTKEALPLSGPGAGVWLAKDTSDLMKGAPAPKMPPFRALAKKPGFVRGLVQDGSGKPIANATIVAQSSAAGGFRTSVTTKTNAQGIYEVKLPIGICEVVNADCRVGQLLLPLHAVDGNRETFDSARGHVENFILRTWGAANRDSVIENPEFGSNYYGAPIRVQWFLDGLPESGTVEVTFKPQGPLLDGSAGKTIAVRLPMKTDGVLSEEKMLNDLPLGRYTMTAQILDGGDTLPLRIKRVFGNQEVLDAMPVELKSSGTHHASLERSGVAQFDVVLQP
jgi:hypothetical protein